jgi:hypothetical protein
LSFIFYDLIPIFPSSIYLISLLLHFKYGDLVVYINYFCPTSIIAHLYSQPYVEFIRYNFIWCSINSCKAVNIRFFQYSFHFYLYFKRLFVFFIMLNFSNPYSQFLLWTNVILFDVCAYRTLINCQAQAYLSMTLVLKLIVMSCWLTQRINLMTWLRGKKR